MQLERDLLEVLLNIAVSLLGYFVGHKHGSRK